MVTLAAGFVDGFDWSLAIQRMYVSEQEHVMEYQSTVIAFFYRPSHFDESEFELAWRRGCLYILTDVFVAMATLMENSILPFTLPSFSEI